MVFTLQNDVLRISVDDMGAELVSVWDKRYDLEWIWDGSGRYWQRHAPVLFPYCGKLLDGKLKAEGKSYPAPIHGFARNMTFACVERQDEVLAFRLCDSEETREFFPYPFELTISFELFGNEVRQTAQVKNPGVPFSLAEDLLPFNLGFHPGFAMSADATSFDYKLLFDEAESPLEIFTPEGYVSGSSRERFSAQKVMAVRDAMFNHGSICLAGLLSDTVTLMNSKSGRAVQVGFHDFDYLLFWGPPKGPLGFMCIEPWNGLPDPDRPYGDFANKPGVLRLKPGDAYNAAMTMTFF